MKYLILLHSTPATRRAWDDMTDEQRRQFARDHAALRERLIATGRLVHSEGLPGPEQATWVSVRDDDILATDGPYAEVKEYLAGFYLVEATKDEAVGYAARLPEARSARVEVRPVYDVDQTDF